MLRSAARLVLRLPPRPSVTQLMRDRLHWLPVQQRITFKLCTLAFKCSHGLAPVYLSRFCTSVATVEARARLRSAASGQLLVPVTRMSTMGRRGFYYACPAAWNALPSALTSDSSLSLTIFRKRLKTVMFRSGNWYYSAFEITICLTYANICLMIIIIHILRLNICDKGDFHWIGFG